MSLTIPKTFLDPDSSLTLDIQISTDSKFCQGFAIPSLYLLVRQDETNDSSVVSVFEFADSNVICERKLAKLLLSVGLKELGLDEISSTHSKFECTILGAVLKLEDELLSIHGRSGWVFGRTQSNFVRIAVNDNF